MNGVLAETSGRGDILLLRGITNRLAVRWQRDSGSGFQPVVLRGKSTVDAASPINAVHMSMTVMNLA